MNQFTSFFFFFTFSPTLVIFQVFDLTVEVISCGFDLHYPITDVEYFFMYLLAICKSSLEKYLFSSFDLLFGFLKVFICHVSTTSLCLCEIRWISNMVSLSSTTIMLGICWAGSICSFRLEITIYHLGKLNLHHHTQNTQIQQML